MSTGVPNKPAEFPITRNDRLPPYVVDVYDENGDPIALAGTAVFSMRERGGDMKITAQAATIALGPDGATMNRLQYDWAAGDTDTSGTFEAEFQVTASGLPRTFPPAEAQRLVIRIKDDLDGA